MAHPSDPTAQPWSSEQLVRLEYEWRRLQRSYAYHPSVRVIPTHGDPPDEYELDLHVRTLVISDEGELQYATRCAVQVTLPLAFPYEAPVVRPLEAVFHPNVTQEAMLILPAWEPTHTLVDLVQRIGQLLSFQTYDPWTVWNPAALEWLNANSGYLPTDPNLDFRPEAGGDPLMRIARHGAGTILQTGKQVHDFCLSMPRPNGPSQSDMQHFVQQVRLGLSLFTEDEISAQVRSNAAEVDDWAAQLPTTWNIWVELRRRHGIATAADTAARNLNAAIADLRHRTAKLEQYAANIQGTTDAPAALAALPAAPELQAALGAFQTSINLAQQALAGVAAQLGPVSSFSPLISPAIGSMQAFVQQQIDDAQARADAAATDIRVLTKEATPVVQRAGQEAAALQRLVRWREYADLMQRGHELVTQVRNWGSGGVQSYFMAGDESDYGPFELEQRLDLGEIGVAVRNIGRSGMEVWDLIRDKRLGKSAEEQITVSLTDPATRESYQATFRLTGRADDLRVRFSYLATEAKRILAELKRPSPQSPSWCGQLLARLSDPAVFNDLAARHEDATAIWSGLAFDLQQLSPFKARVATYYLAERLSEMGPRFQGELSAARQALQQSTRKLSDILSRCGEDLETQQPVISAKFAKPYTDTVAARENAQLAIARLEALLQRLAAQMRTRLASPTMFGVGDLPDLSALGQLPENLRALAPAITDLALHTLVTQVEKALGESLWPQEEPPAAAPQEYAYEEPHPQPELIDDAVAEDQVAMESESPAVEEPTADAFGEATAEESTDAHVDDSVIADWPESTDA